MEGILIHKNFIPREFVISCYDALPLRSFQLFSFHLIIQQDFLQFFLCPGCHSPFAHQCAQGWHHGKGLIYYRPHSANKISLPQGQNYIERKYLLTAPKI